MAFCGSCGSQIVEGDRFCRSCGEPNASEAPASIPKVATKPAEQPPVQAAATPSGYTKSTTPNHPAPSNQAAQTTAGGTTFTWPLPEQTMQEELREGTDSKPEKNDELPPQSRMGAARERAAAARDQALSAKGRALASAREQLQNSIESGRAEKVGHSTIDALAKGATMGVPLLPLPLGTRRAGRSIGNHLIGRLQEAGHDRVDANLTAAESVPPVQPQSGRLSGREVVAQDSGGAEGEAMHEEAPPISPPTATQPAGWYPDPWGESLQRYHDGMQWTGHTAPR